MGRPVVALGPITLVLPARGSGVQALQPNAPAHGASLGLRDSRQ